MPSARGTLKTTPFQLFLSGIFVNSTFVNIIGLSETPNKEGIDEEKSDLYLTERRIEEMEACIKIYENTYISSYFRYFLF